MITTVRVLAAMTSIVCLMSCGGGDSGGIAQAPASAAKQSFVEEKGNSPVVQWAPRMLSLEIPVGSQKTVALAFASPEPLDAVSLAVNQALAPYITVSPEQAAATGAASAVQVVVTAKIPEGTSLGTYDGVLQLRWVNRAGVVAKPLPIVLIVTAPAPIEVPFTDVTFYNETTNPLQLSFKPKNGSLTTLFGTKDEFGNSTSLGGFYFNGGDGSRSHVFVDATGRPTSAGLPDGSTLKFLWTSASQAVVSVVTPDGRVQANVSLDLSPQTVAALTSGGTISGKSLDPAGAQMLSALAIKKPRSLVFKQGAEQLAQAPSAQALELVNGILSVSVSTSGVAESGATVWANVTPTGTGGTGYNLPLSEGGAGQYSAGFVNFPSSIPPGSVETACNSIVGTTKNYCSGLVPVATGMTQGGCAAIGAAVSFIATPALGAAVFASCESVSADAIAACAVTQFVPQGTQPGLCKAIDSSVAFFDPDGVTIKADASKDGRSGSATQSVPGTQTSVQMSVSLPAPPCAILTFSTSPLDPAPFQGYVASVTTTCGAPGTSISMSMSGSDGFSTSTTCSAVSTCQLSVPGAEAGVTDRVNVNTSSGDARTTALVF